MRANPWSDRRRIPLHEPRAVVRNCSRRIVYVVIPTLVAFLRLTRQHNANPEIMSHLGKDQYLSVDVVLKLKLVLE